MEEVAIMVPASTTIVNDDLSDETESINLDLHVSDTEDSTESTKKGDQIESEEDILNKYVDDAAEDIKELEESNPENEKATLPNGAKSPPSEETTNYEKCNGNASPILGEIDEEEEEDGGGDMEKTPENDNKEEEKKDDNEEVISEETEKIPLEQTEEVCEENEEKMDEDVAEEETKSESEIEETKSESEIEETKSESEIEETKSESEIEKIEDECEKVSSEETNKETSDSQCDESAPIDETNNDRTIMDSEISDKKPDDSAETKDKIDELPKETDNSNSEVVSDKEKLEDKSSKEDETTDTKPSTTTTEETKTEELEDNDDLLCVMEEKTEDGTTDHKDENSCSASEKDEDTKDAEQEDETKDQEQEEERENEEKEQEQEEAIDETKDDEEMLEENPESQLDMDVDNSEIAMDIEESDIGGVVYSDHDQSRDSKTLPDKDANKENELESDVVVSKSSSSADSSKIVKENGLTNGDIDEVVEEQTKVDEVKTAGADIENNDDVLKKSTKRQLSDTSTEGDSPKKIKLAKEAEIAKPLPEKRTIYQLDSLKKFMLDKKLKKLTRFELEELCIQKVCECIVNKSEIGELRQKVLLQEQTIDTWRKEAIVVAKQTRDLKIVHERLMADLKVMKEQTGKPLVPVKITRSVGLQAIIENPSRVRSVPVISGPTTTSQTRTPIVNNQNKTVASPQNRQQVKPKVIQRPQNNTRPLQPITQKNNVSNTKTKPVVPSSPQQKKPADPKTVIDLTDEDEKNHNAKKTTTTASPTVRILNKQTTSNANSNSNTKQVASSPNSQASKIMFVSPNVLQRNSAVMVKMNSNGLVSPQNGLTTIPNGQVSMVTTPGVRTVSQVRVPVTSVATVRTTPSVQQTKQLFKHPAPLPAAPNYQISAPGKKPIPPKPHLNLTRSSCGTGIVLQWKMPYKLEAYEPIVSYQLYAYQETKSPPKTDNWGKIGDVKALELPMAVTLTQFAVGNRYFFAVRAVDSQKRLGPFSEPESILL